MSTDEREIIAYLKTVPNQLVSGREISRRVGGRERFELDSRWATPILRRMAERGWLESDPIGHYRLRQEDPKKKKSKKHVSPEMLKILKKSGKSFDGISLDDAGEM